VPEIRRFFDEHYRPANIVVAAAGDVDHAALARDLDARYSRPGGVRPVREAPGLATVPLDVVARDSEQAHLVLGVRGPDRHSPERYALSILNHTLGGGLSSRLFQKVREERGLCYSIVSDRIAYSDAGALAVSVGTAPERAQEVLTIVADELADLEENGITERELALAKGHLKADTLLALEDSGSRMGRIGASLLLHGEVLEIDAIAERIDAVTTEDVATLAARVLGGARTLAVVGPFSPEEFDTAALRIASP
jgi:predicted Zn-dependent peptidase